MPAISEQSASAAHGPQVFVVVLQSDAPAVLQSAFDKHATHAIVVGLHWGFAAFVQVALLKHSTQVLRAVSQTVLPVTLAQSPLVLHSTQVFIETSHAGFVPEQ